jgi:hypothetical protein
MEKSSEPRNDGSVKQKKLNPKPRQVRTLFVPKFQKSFTNDRNDEAEAPTVFCKDCKAASPVELLIRVDALHVQCPQCLYVFYLDELTEKTLAGPGCVP